MIPHPIYIVNNFFLFYQGKLYYTTLYITTTFYQFYFNFFLKPPLFSSNRHTRLYAPEINLLSFNIVFPQTEPEILHQYPVFFRCQRYIFLSLRDIQNERIIPLPLHPPLVPAPLRRTHPPVPCPCPYHALPALLRPPVHAGKKHQECPFYTTYITLGDFPSRSFIMECILGRRAFQEKTK